MADIDPNDARDHLELVERIIAESSRRLCYGAEYFTIWGLYSAAVTVMYQLVSNGIFPIRAIWFDPVALVVAIGLTIWRARSEGPSGRRSILQREFFNVLWISIAAAGLASFLGFNIFTNWAQAAIWSVAQIIVLLYIGVHGNRTALVCTAAVTVSLVVANFVPPSIAGYVLAAGMFLGYTGFGIAESFARD